MLVDLVVLLLISNVDSGLSVFVLLVFPDHVELIGFVDGWSWHSPLVLLLGQRDVQEIEEPQVHLGVDFKLTVLLEDAQDAELSVENKVLVRLDQNISDGHDAVLQGFLLKLVKELRGRNLLTRCFDGHIGHVAILSPHRAETGDALGPFLGILHVLFVIVEEPDVVVEDLEKAVNVVLLYGLPLDSLILGDFENGRGQEILDGSFRLLNDVPQAVKHVAQAVWLPLVVEHLIQEYVERLVTEEVRIESGDFAGLEEDGAQRLHDEGIVVDVEHLYQVADHIVVIQLLVQVMELHQEV